ncbi:MAG: alanine racemase [Gaiellales bacterium]
MKLFPRYSKEPPHGRRRRGARPARRDVASADRTIGVLVECDTGLGRTDVQTPEEAAELAHHVAELLGLEFRGLMTYPTLPASAPLLRAARELIEVSGLEVAVVSGGDSSTYAQTHLIGEVLEVRCGTNAYGDAAVIAEGSVPFEDAAFRTRARRQSSDPGAGRRH